jgi:hypothetical protein
MLPLDNGDYCPRDVIYRDGFGFGTKRPGMDQSGTDRHGVRVAYSRWSVHVLPFTEHALPFLREQDLLAKQNSTIKKQGVNSVYFLISGHYTVEVLQVKNNKLITK